MEEHKWRVVGLQRTYRAIKASCMMLWWWIPIITRLSKLYRMYSTNSPSWCCAFPLGAVHNVNYRLWVIIICQCSFISYTKTCVGNVDNGGGYGRVAFLVTQTGKESACSGRGLGSMPRLGRSPGEGKGYPFQYSGLESSMDRGAWWATVHGVAKSWTQLSTKHFHFM